MGQVGLKGVLAEGIGELQEDITHEGGTPVPQQHPLLATVWVTENIWDWRADRPHHSTAHCPGAAGCWPTTPAWEEDDADLPQQRTRAQHRPHLEASSLERGKWLIPAGIWFCRCNNRRAGPCAGERFRAGCTQRASESFRTFWGFVCLCFRLLFLNITLTSQRAQTAKLGSQSTYPMGCVVPKPVTPLIPSLSSRSQHATSRLLSFQM